jgi:hypothetical protein
MMSGGSTTAIARGAPPHRGRCGGSTASTDPPRRARMRQPAWATDVGRESEGRPEDGDSVSAT